MCELDMLVLGLTWQRFRVSLVSSSTTVVPKFFIWERENKVDTLSVSSMSPLAEHGSVVGKCIMQLSEQVSVTQFANTKDLLQRQNFCNATVLQRMFLELF